MNTRGQVGWAYLGGGGESGDGGGDVGDKAISDVVVIVVGDADVGMELVFLVVARMR